RYQRADFLDGDGGRDEATCLDAAVAEIESAVDFLERLEQLVLGNAEGEKELGLAIEEERGETVALAGPDAIGEVDVRGEVLPAGVGEKIARHTLPRVRRRGAVAAQARAEERLLLI